MTSGYERNYYNMRRNLADCDFAARARELGLEPPENGVLRVGFLGHLYRVDGEGIEPEGDDGGGDASYNARSVIIYYLTYGGTGEPSFDFRTVRSFAHGLFDGDRGVAWGDKLKPELTLEAFRAAAERMGAELTQSKNGAHSYLLYVFPKIPALITYNEGDDEFPADVTVKFGTNALNFIPFETLAVLHALVEHGIAGGGGGASFT